MEIFGEIEEWTMTKTKFEAMDILNKHDIPCGPILSMKEIAEEPSLRKTGTVVEVDHPTRGKYLTVGNPIKMSDSPTEVHALAAAGRAHRRGARGARLRAATRSRRCAPKGHLTDRRAASAACRAALTRHTRRSNDGRQERGAAACWTP